MIVSTLLFLLILAAKLWYDIKQWKKKVPINHKIEIIIVGIVCIPIAILMAKHSAANFVFALPLSVIVMACFWWPVFDIAYNLIRREKPFFTGSEDGKDDAKFDNFLQGLKLWQHVGIKALCLVLSLYIYLKILN